MPNSSSVLKIRPDSPPVQQSEPETEQSLPTANSAYIPTLEESKLLAARARIKAGHALPTVSFKIQDGGKCATVEFDHPNKAVAIAIYTAALRTVTVTELYAVLNELAYFAQRPDGTINESKVNSMVQTLVGMRPRDIAEAMLCTQMVALHSLTMTTAARLVHESTVQKSDLYERSLNRLARTYTAQLTTLKQYRSSGKQKITVERVTVNSGGQAIVGDVTHGGPGGGIPENPEATA